MQRTRDIRADLLKFCITTILGAGLLVFPGCAKSQDGGERQLTEPAPPKSGPDFETAYIGPLATAVDLFLSQASNHPESVDRQTEFIDLNDDGQPDALVQLEGAEFCSSGGCTVLVFSYDSASGSYKPVSVIAPVLTPLLVSSSLSSGWRDLVVVIPGTGVNSSSATSYSVLEHNGTSYPRSPSNGRRLEDGNRPEGELVF